MAPRPLASLREEWRCAALNERLLQPRLCAGAQLYRLRERLQRLGPEPLIHPRDVARIGDAPASGSSRWRHAPPVGTRGWQLLRVILQRLPVFWKEGIQIDQLGDALTHPVRNSSDDHASIAVTNQYNTLKILVFENAGYILDVGLEIDLGRE